MKSSGRAVWNRSAMNGWSSRLVGKALADHPQELAAYLNGKETLVNWFFGQVMKAGGGQVNPGLVRAELERQLARHKEKPN